MVIHGGFWRDRYDRTLMDALCADLAASGWAAWNLEYRRVGAAGAAGRRRSTTSPRGSTTWPSVRAPLDLARVVAIGHSAGGHLALWAAARDRPGVGRDRARSARLP